MAGRRQRYRAHHDAMRRVHARAVAAGAAVCVRCGLAIDPADAWDLDHLDGGGPHDYAGPAHASCNRSAGAAKGNAARRARAAAPATAPRWSRHWYGGFDQRCPECRARGGPCPDAVAEAVV